jgi:hypothetical protein
MKDAASFRAVLDDGVADTPDGLRNSTRGEISAEVVDRTVRIKAEYTGTLGQEGWLAVTRASCAIETTPDGRARFDMQMTAVENGVEIARSSVQTEIRNILPAAKN